jgi:uncharacterized protein YbjT (DUF2867 family)
VQVFVAGATGRLGARVVRELLAASPQLRVRAGVRNPEAAAGYLQAAVAYGLLPPDAARRVQLVPADITQPDSLPSAIGNASKVRGCTSQVTGHRSQAAAVGGVAKCMHAAAG